MNRAQSSWRQELQTAQMTSWFVINVRSHTLRGSYALRYMSLLNLSKRGIGMVGFSCVLRCAIIYQIHFVTENVLNDDDAAGANRQLGLLYDDGKEDKHC